MTMPMNRSACALAVAFLIATPCVAQEDVDARMKDAVMRRSGGEAIDPDLLLRRMREFRITAINGNTWINLGPTNGAGRMLSIAPHPTVPGTLFAGAAGGGVWKTTDSGATWTPVSESIPNLATSAIAIAPSNPNIIYLGTGEVGPNGDRIPGVGLLASSDGGSNWTLPNSVLATGVVRISVHPSNPQELVVATNAGAWRSTGGLNGPWTEVIAGAKPGGYGAIGDIVRDPSNAQVLYAATWAGGMDCAVVACATINAVPSTVLKSTDGGVTWSPSAAGLPVFIPGTSTPSRISLAIAKSSPQTLYASLAVVPLKGGTAVWHVFKTTNGGAIWSDTSLANNIGVNRALVGNGQYDYDNTIGVSPTNPNIVLVGGVTYAKTADGGQTWNFPGFGQGSVHTDAHDIRYDAANMMIIANDGGIWTSTDDANTATDRTTGLVTQQFYSLANDPVHRNRLVGGIQDIGTRVRPDAGGTSWDTVLGGDGVDNLIHPMLPGVIFATLPNTIYRSVSPDAARLTYRTITPLFPANESSGFATRVVADPSNPAVYYTATNRVWKTMDGGETWTPLPITTTGGPWPTPNIFRIAIATSQPQTMMVVFTNSSTFARTTNGGATWSVAQVSTSGRAITNITIDPRDANRIWVTVAGMSGPSVYRSTNGGSSWNAIANGLPAFSAQVLRVDPTDSSTLYAGTDVGVYRSTDSGDSWTRFGSGMPAVAVDDLQILDDGSALRAATHGRGVWELVITGNANKPAVTISAPASPLRATRSVPVTFTGTGGSSWIFPDNWTTSSASSVVHTFNRAGRFPVSLRGVDAATVDVLVADAGDSCETPIEIPASGPFPFSVTINTEGATSQSSDPATISACLPGAVRQTTTWVSFTPASSGTYNFTFCGSRTSAVLVGYTGNACGPYTANSICLSNALQQLESPTIDCATATKTSATLTGGTTARFLVTNLTTGDFGPVTLSVSQSPVGAIVTSVSPASGSTAGGTPIVVTGNGFVAGMSVQIGGAAATNVVVLTPNLATAVTPKGNAGAATISASFPNAPQATLANAFTYEVLAVRRRSAPH
jgi:photosystem II stability/assembly factor-like uncharacterized protein